MRGLVGKVVVVTGGASGIGRACVERFVEEGCTTIVADVQREPGEAVADELGDLASYLHLDVTDEESIAALVDTVVERHGRLDVFMANAAVFGAIGPIAEQRTPDVDLTLAVNLRGVILSLKHAARAMVPQGSGVIITTASPGGLIGGAGPHVYSATKAGIIGLTRSVAAELRPRGIRVTAVVPGAIASAMTASALVGDADDLEATAERMAKGSMLGRAGLPEDLAGAVAFLASDDAGYVTGSELFVDAGYTHASGAAYFAGEQHAGAGALLEGGRRTS
ncbi:SDR family NAD(P)-dependent oxidoreductase [Nocardioides deserti]|uniref:SDR family oxidoreductase n=1 Tax=Nocardioides deserti TaxID=1588644 RepID=A0ABR6U6L5_9ACTN|nr:SDR family oxidoreductase [Nocardioides deserti]MBC2960079.1 SDR family oxidoreductase [Nocardioides deserti]